MTHAINFVVSIILTLAGWVLEVIGVADAFLAGLMTSAGIPANLQVIILIVVALMLIVLAIRALGGVFGALIVVLLLLLILHRLVPGLQVPHSILPTNLPQAGSVHT